MEHKHSSLSRSSKIEIQTPVEEQRGRGQFLWIAFMPNDSTVRHFNCLFSWIMYTTSIPWNKKDCKVSGSSQNSVNYSTRHIWNLGRCVIWKDWRPTFSRESLDVNFFKSRNIMRMFCKIWHGAGFYIRWFNKASLFSFTLYARVQNASRYNSIHYLRYRTTIHQY